MSRDKRRSVRKPADSLEVSCSISNKEFKGFVENISENGVCIRTQEDLKKGDKVGLKIRLFPKLPSVKGIIGKVVWKNGCDTCGVKYKRMNTEALEVLQGYLGN